MFGDAQATEEKRADASEEEGCAAVPEEGDVVDHERVQAGPKGVDYARLVKQFGTTPIVQADLDRLEKITGQPPHLFLRRGLYFSHRDLNVLLDGYERGELFYIFTGRGPSASMHLGHVVPFHFAAYLQAAFKAPVVIQISDDEKFFFKDLSLAQCSTYAADNVRDIIACGFDSERTFIFSDLEQIGMLYPTVCAIERRVTVNQMQGAFGVKGADCVGKMMYPAVQMAPAFPTAFTALFGGRPLRCLVPMGIDQDPYFRIARDVARGLKMHKPAVVHNKFLPALSGQQTKMSASLGGTIELRDTPKQVRKKMGSALSGARGDGSLEAHRKLGADLEVDVPIRYLQYFLEDNDELARVEAEYGAGRLTCGEVKRMAADAISALLRRHQAARERVTDDDVARFQAVRPLL